VSAARAGRRLAALLALAWASAGSPLAAQTTTMPSTLRWGSGLIDVPVASTLPRHTLTATLSGFFLRLDRTVEVDASGDPVGFGPGVHAFHTDAAVAYGLSGRSEVGATLQSLDDGRLPGLFGRFQLVRPENQGIGLAVGARWVAGPEAAGGVDARPNRLGLADPRFRTYPGRETISTGLTLYGVTTAHMRGGEGGFLPRYDLTFSLGYGDGLFKDGGDLAFYGDRGGGGWFLGSALHVGVRASVVTLMAEYDGFDVNVGTQVDLRGVRVGAQLLGVNHDEPSWGWDSEYRSRRFGLQASVAICPGALSRLCAPKLMERPERGVIQLPAPPPDTVLVERPRPEGTPARLCLATGENVRVIVTARGDTLVGPEGASMRELGATLVFAGRYAGSLDWYLDAEPLPFSGQRYRPSGGEESLDCGELLRVGTAGGVSVFAPVTAESPYAVLWVPVRPGVWRMYLSGG